MQRSGNIEHPSQTRIILTPCLSPDELDGFIAGELEPEPRAAVEAHIRSCHACQTRLEKLRQRDEEWIVGVQNAFRVFAHDEPRSSDSSSGFALPLPPRSGAACWRVPNYRICHEIARGAQGVVYLAKHERLNCEVAIKFLTAGEFASPAERARFDREAKIGATLNHENIVHVRDTGSANNCPYLVMDYIAGQSLNEYVARKQLSRKALLTLFRTICNAVHAAHMHGVIHRDLKPANIRVDAKGVPHIMDFGLARVAMTSSISQTLPGSFVGNIKHASPEQVEPQGRPLDIRSDIYSLGVMLYELLTGRPPYRVDGSISEVFQRILHEEPRAPQTLALDLGSDLNTIVLRCLRKDPDDRYQTAAELGRDLQHLLDGEPIESKQDRSWLLVLRNVKRDLRRYRFATLTVAAFAILLVIGLAFMGWLWATAETHRKAAEFARQAETEQRELAQANATEARRQQAVAEAARHEIEIQKEQAEAMYVYIERMFAKIDPAKARGKPYSVEALLDDAAVRINYDLEGQPSMQAAMHETVGSTYQRLGLFDEARRHLEQAVELRRSVDSGQRELMNALTLLGRLYQETADFAVAEKAYLEALKITEQIAPTDMELRAQRLGELTRLLIDKRDLEKAERIAKEALDLARQTFGSQHANITMYLTDYATVYQFRGQYDQAEDLLVQALDIRRALPGRNTASVVSSLNNLANMFLSKGDIDRAEQRFHEALDLAKPVLPPNHRYIHDSNAGLGACLTARGQYEKAEALLQASYEGLKIMAGERNPRTRQAVKWLIQLYDAWNLPEKRAEWESRL